MQPHNPSNPRLGSTLLASLCVCALLPSCALKRLADRSENESAVASAESLENALAILDSAIEETESASEIGSIPLDVPAFPEDLEPTKPAAPSIELVDRDDEQVSGLKTLFEASDEAVTASASPAEASVIEVVPEKPREHVVVKRPSPNYSRDTHTTVAIDEFRKVRTTAYCHTEADHIEYGELSAEGKPLRFGMVRSAAADWSRYPVGTRFRIVGKPYEYVIDDYGSALVGTDTIDLYKPSDDRMNDWGVRQVEIEVIAWGSFEKSLEILEPRKEKGDHIMEMIKAMPTTASGQKLASNSDSAFE